MINKLDKNGVHPCSPRIKVEDGYIGCDDSPPCQNIDEDVIIDYEECQKRCRGCCESINHICITIKGNFGFEPNQPLIINMRR